MLEQLIVGLHLASIHDAPVHKEERCQYEYGFGELGGTVLRCQADRKPSNANYGVYARDPGTGLGAGVVLNSEEHWSFHADWTYELHPNIGLTLGGVTGYEKRKVMAVFVPSLKFTIPETKIDTRWSYIYGRHLGKSNAVHLSIESLLKW